MLGRAVSEMQYILIENYLATGRSLTVESAFFVEFARPELQRILAQYPARTLEVYCQTDATVRRQRFSDRAASGNRHQGHQDGTDLALLTDDDPEPLETYAPLEVGEVIIVDTTSFGDAEYATLVAEISKRLKS